MTYNDLKTEVAALGFDEDIENDEALLKATRRALNFMFTERPIYKSLVIHQLSKTPVSTFERIMHNGGATDSVLLNGIRSYSFKTSGIGKYSIKDAAGEHEFDFSGTAHHRGFVHGDGEIKFFGDYAFCVYDVALFDELFGPGIDDIPLHGEFTEYDVESLASDFLSFVNLPRDTRGIDISGATVNGKTVKIPKNYEGKITITYKARPKDVSGRGEEQIPTPTGCEHLLALLVSAYVWLDDDPDKAQYYMSLYREGMSAVKYYDRPQMNFEYINVNGWA